jgi:homopolymeric O-antigen transport system permease protein
MKPHTYSFFGELFASRNVLWQLVAQQLILRYRRTALGYLWTLINPLLMMSIMALVFSTLFNADLKTFAVFLFTGMIPWNFFSSVVTQSGTSFINNEGLIKKIYLPKVIFPLSITSALLIDTIFSFFALFIIILTLGGPLSWALLFIPIAFLLLFLFTLGIGLITSIATVYFRDLQYVILIIMQALFFLTPILYKPESLKGKVAWLITLNPVVPFIDLFRAPLYLGSLPSQSTIILSILFSLVSITIGLIIFLWQEKKIVFRL